MSYDKHYEVEQWTLKCEGKIQYTVCKKERQKKSDCKVK